MHWLLTRFVHRTHVYSFLSIESRTQR